MRAGIQELHLDILAVLELFGDSLIVDLLMFVDRSLI
jgi:hypothetical protein